MDPSPTPDPLAPAALTRALIACLLLPGPGLGPALLLLVGPKALFRRRHEPLGSLGLFTFASISLGLGLLVTLGLIVLFPPLVGTPISGRQLALGVLLLVLGAWLLQRRFVGPLRLRPEPGLHGLSMLVGLLVLVAAALLVPDRLFHGLERLVLSDPSLWAALRREDRRLDPTQIHVHALDGLEPVAPDTYQVTRPRSHLRVRNRSPHGIHTHLVLVLSGPPGSLARWRWAEPDRCDPTAGKALPDPPRSDPTWSEARIPSRHQEVKVAAATPRLGTLLYRPVMLPPGSSCFQLGFEAAPGSRLDQIQVFQASSDSWADQSAGGRFQLMQADTLECHLTDEVYRQRLHQNFRISPQLLLFGYFIQTVVSVLTGSPYPVLGVLFLCLCLWNLAAAQILLAAASPRPRIPSGPWQPALLLAIPVASHAQSLIRSPALSFAFPDAAYTTFLLSALALLTLRHRRGFILLGCLAACTRYPGAFVLGLALISQLWLLPEERRWTWRTFRHSFEVGLIIIAVLLVYFNETTGIMKAIQGLYFEIVPEHFTSQGQALPLGLRSLFFLGKMLLLAALTPVLWPLCRTRGALFLVLITLGYALTLMTVHHPHDHYFQLLIYTGSAAGLSTLPRLPAALRPLVPVLMAVTVAAAPTLVEEASILLHRSVL